MSGMIAFTPSPSDPFRNLDYLPAPDYSQALRGAPPDKLERIRKRLALLYGEARSIGVARNVDRLIKVHDAYSTPELRDSERAFDPRARLTERDVILITYGDLVLSKGRSPLRTLSDFTFVLFRGLITTVHVLPFFPSSSDRGFSVTSYEEVDPRLGSWDEIAQLGRRFRLMFDGVFNHISSKSRRFQQFLAGDPLYSDYFRVFSSKEEIDPDRLRLILRPRTSDLLSPYATVDGLKWLWTTFSRDQIDLNFRNPDILVAILEILLHYVRRGSDLVRLDAVTYIWHELGTACAHLQETHEIVKLMRDVLDVAAPHVSLVTETNVPHRDNVTYFGDGSDEAQMVYNAFVSGSAEALLSACENFQPPSETTAFFNFLDSHDGIGLLGARGILPAQEIERLCQHVRDNGGLVSMRANGDGTESPYELNITWFSALNGEASNEPVENQVDRFIASRAIALSLRGVPGIYLSSFFGSRNDLEAVKKDGMARSINRAAFREDWLFEQFGDPLSVPSRIISQLTRLLELRSRQKAFHPATPQRALHLDPRVFSIVRAPEMGNSILCLVNVTGSEIPLTVSPAEIGGEFTVVTDVVSGLEHRASQEGLRIPLAPYQVAWLRGGRL
jgi:sucrose phosphorylase